MACPAFFNFFKRVLRTFRFFAIPVLLGPVFQVSVTAQTPVPAASPLPALKIRGEDFVDPAGHAVRFWGMNLIATYPEHKLADALAANLASLQINLVRPHHLLGIELPSSAWHECELHLQK